MADKLINVPDAEADDGLQLMTADDRIRLATASDYRPVFPIGRGLSSMWDIYAASASWRRLQIHMSETKAGAHLPGGQPSFLLWRERRRRRLAGQRGLIDRSSLSLQRRSRLTYLGGVVLPSSALSHALERQPIAHSSDCGLMA